MKRRCDRNGKGERKTCCRVAVFLALPILMLILTAATAPAAVVETVYPNPAFLQPGDSFTVQVQVTDNDRPIGAFALWLVYTNDSLQKTGDVTSTAFNVMEFTPQISGNESRVLLGATASDIGNGAPPDAVLFTAPFQVKTAICGAAVRIEAVSGSFPLTDLETFQAIPTTFDNSATDHLYGYMVTGDITGDGHVNAADVQRLDEILLARRAPDAQSAQGDLNGTCELDIGDLIRMRK